MTTATLDPVSVPVSEEEQVRALHELLKEEGEALLIGKGGKPAMKLPDAVYDLLKILSVMEEGKRNLHRSSHTRPDYPTGS